MSLGTSTSGYRSPPDPPAWPAGLSRRAPASEPSRKLPGLLPSLDSPPSRHALPSGLGCWLLLDQLSAPTAAPWRGLPASPSWKATHGLSITRSFIAVTALTTGSGYNVCVCGFAYVTTHCESRLTGKAGMAFSPPCPLRGSATAQQKYPGFSKPRFVRCWLGPVEGASSLTPTALGVGKAETDAWGSSVLAGLHVAGPPSLTPCHILLLTRPKEMSLPLSPEIRPSPRAHSVIPQGYH